MGLGLGVWTGRYEGVLGQWLRWYDAVGDWIPTNAERATIAEVRAATALEQVQVAEAKATSEAQARREAIPRLKALELSVAQIAEALGLAVTEVED